VEVDEQSSADADRATVDDSETPAAWTAEAFTALLERLRREAPVQAGALQIAIPSARCNRRISAQSSTFNTP
jgi:hypothetical protein